MFKKYPCTMQHDASDCAAAAISTVLLVYKQEMSLMKIREVIGTDLYGTSVKGIVDGLEKLKFQVKAVRAEMKDITDDMTYPAIAQIHTTEGLNHFVVIQKVRHGIFYVSDPAKGNIKLKREEIQKLYTGVLIMMIPTSEFEKMKYKDKGMFDLFCALILPQKRLLLTIILASFVLSIIGILSSTFSKVLMDEIIPYQLKNKLYIFLLAYGLVVLSQNLLSAFKQQIVLFLSRKVDIPLLMGYYNHIIHLPYEFFASRRVGDIITRFQDALTIKDIFTTVSVSLILDIVLSLITGVISSFINSLGGLVFMAIGAMFIIDGKMSIGDLLVFQTLSQYFTEPIQSLVSLQLTFQEANIAMTRLNELMSLDREDEHREELIDDIDLLGDICFENVQFSYGSRPPVIKNFNLTIPSGKRVALVGESGAGKSTIAKLLLKFMDVKEGKVTISGCNVHDIDEAYLRRNIAYIPQNIELFTGTIIDNLKIGNPEAKYEEIMTACQLAGASSFIEKLPNRYGAFIEEGGSNLSGGEKQRLAIARAILSKSQVFIFDEATSHLDSFSERKIHDLLFKKIKNTTTLIIAHRLSTIVNCDLICFVENGRIIEQGTHDELIAMNGQYAKMISLQNMTMLKVNKTVINEEEINYG